MNLRVLVSLDKSNSKWQWNFLTKLQGKIIYQHAYIDFSNLQVTVPKAGGGGDETVKTCPAAMGFGDE